MSKCELLTLLLVLLMAVSRSRGLINRRNNQDIFRSMLLEESSEEEEEDYSSPHAFVEQNNGYCNFQRNFGPSCNMTGSNAVLTVQERPALSLKPHIMEVEVHNASMVLLYPVCLPWVQLFGVRDLVTKQPQGKLDEASSCRTWLRSYNSHLSSVSSAVKDLSLVNSSVDVIDLHNLRDFLSLSSNVSVIQHLDWQGYAGLVRDTHIGSIVSMQCNDNISMAQVVIDQIGWGGLTFAGDSMKVNTTSFGKVFSQGVHIVKGEAKFLNSVFEDLSFHGVTVKPGATLMMQNVSIERCERPCLVIPYSDSVVFHNVTIEGLSLEEVPEAVLYSGEDLATYGNFSLQHAPECQTDSENSEIITCDFNYSNQTVFLTGQDNYTSVTINHSLDFHVIGVCNLNLTLNNSSGLYTSNSRNEMNSSCTSGEDGGSLTATNTSFHGLDTRHLAQLTLRECSVRSLHTRAPLQQVLFGDSAVDVLWLMVSAEASWTDTMAKIATASVGNLQALRMRFSNVVNLTIGDNGGNSSITDSTFEYCSIHGLTVTGSLVLTNVTFKETAALPIFLAEGANLYLQDVTFLRNLTRHVISAASQEQIVWLNQDNEDLPSDLVYVRPTPADAELVSIVGDKPCKTSLRFELSSSLSFRLRPRSYMECDYNNSHLGDNVVMRHPPGPYPLTVIISAAGNLSLESFCSSKITVEQVKMVTMDEKDDICHYELLGFNSSFDTITNLPTEVSLHDSSARIIESSGIMQTLYLNNSSVQVISTAVQSAAIIDSQINHLSFLHVKNFARFKSSSLGTIASLELRSYSFMTHCTISTLNTNAIHIYDKFLIVNTTIQFMNNNSIVFYEDAHLMMTNVTIEHGWIESFQSSLGRLTLINVTLNGVPLEQSNFIKTDVTDSTRAPATPSTTNTPPPPRASSSPALPPSSSAPPQSSTEAALLPDGPDQRNTGGDGGSSTQPWMRWASAGAAIFLGLLVVLIILSVTIVVRANRQGQPILPALSGFFSRRRDDQTFLSTEMEPTVRDPSVTHYVRLPS